jgi:hypothetical protein
MPCNQAGNRFTLCFQWFHACFGPLRIFLLITRFKVRALVGAIEKSRDSQ